MPPTESHGPVPPTSNAPRPVSPVEANSTEVSSEQQQANPPISSPIATELTAAPRQVYVPQLIVGAFSICFIPISSSILGGVGIASLRGLLVGILLLITLGVSIYSLTMQWKLYRYSHPRLYTAGHVFLAIAIIFPVLAVILGDLVGSAEYHNATELTPAVVAGVILIASASAACTVATANAIYIASRFHAAVKILGIIGSVLAYLFIAGISFILFALYHTAHDPNSE